MSRNDAIAKASIAQVWGVLSDPMRYSEWVVGAKEVRGADAEWPAFGSRLLHTSGAGPIEIKDITQVVAVEPERHIELEARLGSAGVANVVIDLTAEDEGTRIVMTENFVEGAPTHAEKLTNVALKGRNQETLRRLVNLAESAPGD